jgi:hypothetical protein
MTRKPSPTDATVAMAALTGRVALLLAAFVCAIAASLATGATSLVLIVAAFALAGTVFFRPVAIRLGRALKPAMRPPARGTR